MRRTSSIASRASGSAFLRPRPAMRISQSQAIAPQPKPKSSGCASARADNGSICIGEATRAELAAEADLQHAGLERLQPLRALAAGTPFAALLVGLALQVEGPEFIDGPLQLQPQRERTEGRQPLVQRVVGGRIPAHGE